MITTPRHIAPGDRIAILSPARSIRHEYIDNALPVIECYGFEPVVMPHAKGAEGSFSGSIDNRLADFKAALADPTVRAIMCSRGGYGAVHLLDELSPLIEADPKWIIGFSDISALHSLMVSHGIASLHAPMCKHLALMPTDDPCTRHLFAILRGEKPEFTTAAHPYNRPGKVQGQIVGGNMAVMCGLIGSQHCFIKPGSILFIEDIGEEVYKIERMLYQLRLSGVLANLKALVVGQFTEYHYDERNRRNMYDMIQSMVSDYSYPVAYNFPIGHVDMNVPIIEGAEAKLCVDSNGTSLKFT